MNKIIKLQEKIADLKVKLWKEVRKLYPDFNSLWHTVGTFWDCPKSPFNRCVYNDINDRVHDNCIFCHQPVERK